ncbi:hypothetical protein [Streptomyces sp. NPDC057293]|uniref:hypothetical protein n=1 Tax=unclassified Streptomyces TaxID=2593676 RepID=UPI003630554A
MTENKALKKAIRERMAVTGEPYNTARRAVLAQRQAGASISGNEARVAPVSRKAALAGRDLFKIKFPVVPKLDVKFPVVPKLDVKFPVVPKLDVKLPVVPKLEQGHS